MTIQAFRISCGFGFKAITSRAWSLEQLESGLRGLLAELLLVEQEHQAEAQGCIDVVMVQFQRVYPCRMLGLGEEGR